jgi:hypothetical protein
MGHAVSILFAPTVLKHHPLEHRHRILFAGVRSFLSMGTRLLVGLEHEHWNGLFPVRVSCGGDAKAWHGTGRI